MGEFKGEDIKMMIIIMASQKIDDHNHHYLGERGKSGESGETGKSCETDETGELGQMGETYCHQIMLIINKAIS